MRSLLHNDTNIWVSFDGIMRTLRISVRWSKNNVDKVRSDIRHCPAKWDWPCAKLATRSLLWGGHWFGGRGFVGIPLRFTLVFRIVFCDVSWLLAAKNKRALLIVSDPTLPPWESRCNGVCDAITAVNPCARCSLAHSLMPWRLCTPPTTNPSDMSLFIISSFARKLRRCKNRRGNYKNRVRERDHQHRADTTSNDDDKQMVCVK